MPTPRTGLRGAPAATGPTPPAGVASPGSREPAPPPLVAVPVPATRLSTRENETVASTAEDAVPLDCEGKRAAVELSELVGCCTRVRVCSTLDTSLLGVVSAARPRGVEYGDVRSGGPCESCAVSAPRARLSPWPSSSRSAPEACSSLRVELTEAPTAPGPMEDEASCAGGKVKAELGEATAPAARATHAAAAAVAAAVARQTRRGGRRGQRGLSDATDAGVAAAASGRGSWSCCEHNTAAICACWSRHSSTERMPRADIPRARSRTRKCGVACSAIARMRHAARGDSSAGSSGHGGTGDGDARQHGSEGGSAVTRREAPGGLPR